MHYFFGHSNLWNKEVKPVSFFFCFCVLFIFVRGNSPGKKDQRKRKKATKKPPLCMHQSVYAVVYKAKGAKAAMMAPREKPTRRPAPLFWAGGEGVGVGV